VKRIAVVANLYPIKGHETLLRALVLLRERGCSPECWLIGDDVGGSGYRQSLESLVKQLDLKNVRFLGHRSDVAALLPQIQVLVCPSDYEPFGRCLIEAMSAKRAVVASRVGGIPEVVSDGETGMLVPSKDHHELADAIERLLANQQLSKSMGEAGFRRARQHFSCEAHVAKIKAIYEDVLDQRGTQVV
jgi:glycosyltransferase involved in cell wall biosynthesis